MKKLFPIIVLLVLASMAMSACGLIQSTPAPAPTAVVIQASQEDLEKAAEMGANAAIDAFVQTQTAMPTATLAPTATPTNTPAPSPTATPTNTSVVIESGKSKATVYPVTGTVTPTLAITATETLSPTFELVLSDYFSQTIKLSGWLPIELAADGNWYKTNTGLDDWWSIAGTWKRSGPGCKMPGACNVLAKAGVLGADDYDEAKANQSAVWTGSMYHDSPDGDWYGMLIPEGSYVTTYAAQFGKVTIGEFSSPILILGIPSCGAHCGQGLLVRGLLAIPGSDRNVSMKVEDYGALGAASWTEYVVPPEAAEYFSQVYLTAQAENAHVQNNNGSGPNDNDMFIQHVLDLNDMSYTILGHTAQDGWFLIWTNVGAYGTH